MTHPDSPPPSARQSAEIDQPVYGMCTACRSIEVELNRQDGVRNFSHIGESAQYPVGYGCEVCS